MATEVGVGYVSIVPSAKGFGRALAKQINPDMDETGRQMTDRLDDDGKEGGRRFGKSFSSFAKKSMLVGLAGVAIGAAVAAKATVNFMKDSTLAASDLGESVNAVRVTFGEAADGILALGEKASKAVGMSNTEFNGLAVQFANFAQTVAGPGGDVVKVMDDLTIRAADFASVMNLDVAEAARLFQSGLAGESEPLRQYGIDLSAAAVEAYALANGIWDGTEQMTEQEKVLARYGSMMEQTAKTQGDFTNTSGGMANQQRILAAEFTNLKAKVGEAIIPVVEQLLPYLVSGVQWLSAKVTENMPQIQAWMTSFADKIIEKFPIARAWLESLAQYVIDNYPKVRDWFTEAADAVERNWPEIKNTANSIRNALERVVGWTGELWKVWQSLPSEVKTLLAMLAIAQKTGVLSVAFKVTDIVGSILRKIAAMNLQAGHVTVSGPVTGVGPQAVKGTSGKTTAASLASFLGPIGAIIGIGIASSFAITELFKRVPDVLKRALVSDPLFQGAFNLRNFLGFATGGPVGGYGNGDTVPAMLTPGEYVLNKRMVAQAGGIRQLEGWRAGLGGPGGIEVGQIVINNPVAEPASMSLPKAVRKLAYVGVGS